MEKMCGRNTFCYKGNIKNMRIKKNISLKKYTTYRIGGPAKYFCVVKSVDDLGKAQQFAKIKDLKLFLLGGGSNVLFSDDGFDGLVIKIQNDDLEMKEVSSSNVLVRCGAGTTLARLVDFSAKKGLTGFEWATGIPGLVGGAVRGNAGSFNFEIKDALKSVRAFDRNADNWGKMISVECLECDFSYRDSLFKQKSNLVIWDVIFSLKKGEKKEIKKQIAGYTKRRQEKQPPLAQFPSAGSVFKNPVVSEKVQKAFEEDKEIKCKEEKVPAGWLIERCGLKEKKIGDAMVSPKQANFIINMGQATAEDIIILLSLIKMKVRNKFGVQLEEEIQIVL